VFAFALSGLLSGLNLSMGSFAMFKSPLLRLAVLFSFWACAALFPWTAGAAGQKEAIIVLQRAGQGYALELRTPGRAGVAQVALLLKDAGGKPLAGKKITGELLMPRMPMPGYPLELEFYEEENGGYAALAQYAHGGLWRISVRFSGEGGTSVQESFDFELND
jgi:hypothetical protein